MRNFLLKWLAWFLFISVVVSIVMEINRLISGDFVAIRSIWVCSVSSCFMAIFHSIIRK